MAKVKVSKRGKVQEFAKVQPALPAELVRWLYTIAAHEDVTIGVVVARALERERSATGFHVVRRPAVSPSAPAEASTNGELVDMAAQSENVTPP
jgi:hypothetical protein